jgi:hypothetical protein
VCGRKVLLHKRLAGDRQGAPISAEIAPILSQTLPKLRSPLQQADVPDFLGYILEPRTPLLVGSSVRTSLTLAGGGDRGRRLPSRNCGCGRSGGSRRTSPHSHRPREGAGLGTPRPDVVGHGFDAGFDFGWCGQVTLEDGFRAGGFARTISDDRPVVFAVRDAQYHPALFPNCCCRKASDCALRSAPV